MCNYNFQNNSIQRYKYILLHQEAPTLVQLTHFLNSYIKNNPAIILFQTIQHQNLWIWATLTWNDWTSRKATLTWNDWAFPVERNVSIMQCRTAVSNSRNMTSRRMARKSAMVRGSVGWGRFSICFCISRNSAPERYFSFLNSTKFHIIHTNKVQLIHFIHIFVLISFKF